MSEGERYRRALIEGARSVGIAIDDQVANQLAKHWELVARWAKKINLTSVHDADRAASVHGVDSLLFAEAFDPNETTQVIDVGSGAGFPGVILALARPRLKVTLLEPIRKRASFLKVALADLGRPDVVVEEGRLDPVPDGAVPPFITGAIVSRATIPPLELARIAPPYLEAEGRLVLSGGAGAPKTEAIEAAALGQLRSAATHDYVLPGGERRVIEILCKR